MQRREPSTPPPPPPVHSAPADEVAAAALRAAPPAEPRCHACDEAIEGEPYGSGLFVWTRGEERRVEEPPLCARCATAIGLQMLADIDEEEDEG